MWSNNWVIRHSGFIIRLSCGTKSFTSSDNFHGSVFIDVSWREHVVLLFDSFGVPEAWWWEWLSNLLLYRLTKITESSRSLELMINILFEVHFSYWNSWVLLELVGSWAHTGFAEPWGVRHFLIGMHHWSHADSVFQSRCLWDSRESSLFRILQSFVIFPVGAVEDVVIVQNVLKLSFIDVRHIAHSFPLGAFLVERLVNVIALHEPIVVLLIILLGWRIKLCRWLLKLILIVKLWLLSVHGLMRWHPLSGHSHLVVEVGWLVLWLVSHWWLVNVLWLICWLLLLTHGHHAWNLSSFFWLVCGAIRILLSRLFVYWRSNLGDSGTLLDSVELGRSHQAVFLASGRVHHGALGVFIVALEVASLVIVLSHGHGHIFGGSISVIQIIVTHFVVHRFVYHGWLVHLLLQELKVCILSFNDMPHLLDILVNFIEVGVRIFPVLFEVWSRLNVSQNQEGNLFEVELVFTSEWKDLVRVFLVHNDEDVWVALLDNLLSLSEQSSFLDVECFVLDCLFLAWHFGIGISIRNTVWVSYKRNKLERPISNVGNTIWYNRWYNLRAHLLTKCEYPHDWCCHGRLILFAENLPECG